MGGDMANDRDDLRWSIEWTYSPTDFFEETQRIREEHCELSIGDGKIIATIDCAYGDPRPTLQVQLEAELENWFLGAQLVTHKPFKLSRATICHHKPSGGRDIFVETDDLICPSMYFDADFKITDKDGNIIADSRKERDQHMRLLAELAAKHGANAVVKKVLGSFTAAMDDHEGLLVHLFEISEALQTEFGGEKEARRSLRIEKEMNVLGKLANDKTINGSRHSGQSLLPLREATEAELNDAIAAAQKMIENYLKYWEGSL
jgi:hypothetical protein